MHVRHVSCCIGCVVTCLFAGTILGLAVVTVRRTYFEQYDVEAISMMPGNFQRIKVQKDILKALKSNDWSAVENGLTENNFALSISDASGLRWETTRGWTSMDHRYGIASQSKLIAALAIYRLVQRNPAVLSPSTRVSQYIASWPSRPDELGSNATLENLLAFTTGFGKLHFSEGCARLPRSAQPSWKECVDEIAALPITHPPGMTFQYGPWHIVVAAAMAQLAFGRELTMDSWVRTVKEEVWEPSGLTGPPRYPGVYSDVLFQEGNRFPDFSGGLSMSGREWQKVIHALQFGQLLIKPNFEHFISDHATHVDKVVGSLRGKPKAVVGQWHYAQGEWIACDGAARKNAIGVSQENAYCGGASGTPQPHLLHSVGVFGFYVWMDLTNNYNGVFVHSWVLDLMNSLYITLAVTAVAAPLAGLVSGYAHYHRRMGAMRAGKDPKKGQSTVLLSTDSTDDEEETSTTAADIEEPVKDAP